MADKKNPAYDPYIGKGTGGVQDYVPDAPGRDIDRTPRTSYDRQQQRAIDVDDARQRERKDWWGRQGYAKGGMVKHGSSTSVACSNNKIVR